MRIFDAVEHHEKAVLGLLLFEQHVDVGVCLAAGHGDDALVSVGVGDPVEVFARQEADLHSGSAAVIDNPLHTLVVPLAGNSDVIEGARARLDRFAY